MKIRGGLKGLTQQPWHGGSLWRKLRTWWERASSSHHHDLSDAVMNRYNENVEKLKDVLKARDPFTTADSHLVNNIINNNKKRFLLRI